jgi:geranylgeranyl pyrophosphate synthase
VTPGSTRTPSRRCAQVIVDTGALDEVERLVESLVAEAAAALDTSSVAEPARGVLTHLITAATARHT